jgi:hypothetical protein
MLFNRMAKPDFISYDHSYLPNIYVSKTKLPVLTWTVRSQKEYDEVKPYCDNIIFENFLPEINT